MFLYTVITVTESYYKTFLVVTLYITYDYTGTTKPLIEGGKMSDSKGFKGLYILILFLKFCKYLLKCLITKMYKINAFLNQNINKTLRNSI